MYGVPEKLDLASFAGIRLDAITFAQYTIYLSFDSSISITVESSYAYNYSEIKDVNQGNPVEHSELLDLIGRSVEFATRNGRRSLSLHFEGDRTLEMFDDSCQYESFIIVIGDTKFVV